MTVPGITPRGSSGAIIPYIKACIRLWHVQDKERKEDFHEQYRDAEDELPHRMPVVRGRSVVATVFVDASHVVNKKTRRSHTGFATFVNREPVIWYSKRQYTVEASTSLTEVIANYLCLCHNLRGPCK